MNPRVKPRCHPFALDCQYSAAPHYHRARLGGIAWTGPVGANSGFGALPHGKVGAGPALTGWDRGPFISAATSLLGLSAANSPICFSQG